MSVAPDPRRTALGLALVVAMLAAATPVFAQAPRAAAVDQRPAMIKGYVVEAEDGDPLPYTNVYISSSRIGTIALQEGQFFLAGLRPGTYTVNASYISYSLGSETVTVGPGETAVIEFRLTVEAILSEAVEVSAERRLIEIERTGSTHRLSSEQMEALPLDNLVEMIAQKPGVTLQDNEIHIRGGRSDDTQFIIDGVSVNDPLAGGGYGYAIDPSIINEIEVLTGGFNAEYGQAVSGVVNVSTKEGSDRWSGKTSWKRDYWRRADVSVEPDWTQPYDLDRPQNIDVVKASVSGPDPFSDALGALGLRPPGKTYLLLSGSMDVRDGPLPIYSRTRRLTSPMYDFDWAAPRQQNEWNGLAKWTWNVNPRHKLNFTASRQFEISQGFELAGEGYPRPFQDNLDRYLVFTNESILSQLYYRWVMGENDYFELNFGRNFSRQHANINGNDDFTTYPLINSPPSPTGLAFGSADRWHDHFAESWNLKTTYAWVANETNQFKTGLEMNFTEMQLVDLQSSLGSPPPGKLGIKEDIFKVHPIVGAAYIQDTVNYKGMIVNAGLRLDAWAPGREVEYVMDHSEDYLFIFDEMADEFYDNTVEFWMRSWKMRVSPRLGVSFPVTDKDKFFFNYGHFSQWPRYSYVYPQLQAQTATKIQLLGNPNLDPKITVEYETGVQHEFPGLWSLGVTFFNRDIYGYAKSVQMKPVNIGADETPDPNDTGTVTIDPVRYFNGDSARSLGVEFSVIKRTTRWLSGSASLELSRSTGTNSDADEAYLLAVYDEAYTPTASIGGLKRNPLLWDKPWKVSFNLDFAVDKKDRLELFGWALPADWSLNLLFQAEAGQRYTPRDFADPENPVFGEYVYGDPYSELGPAKHSLNLRFNKTWDLSRRQRLTFFFEGRNVLDHKNYRRINPWTGTGYQVGDSNPGWVDNYADWYGEEGPVLNTYSREYVKSQIDPSYVEDPRMLLMGVSFSW